MYHVIVCARNSVGCGQPSPVVNFTTVQALPGEHYIELVPNFSSCLYACTYKQGCSVTSN